MLQRQAENEAVFPAGNPEFVCAVSKGNRECYAWMLKGQKKLLLRASLKREIFLNLIGTEGKWTGKEVFIMK